MRLFFQKFTKIYTGVLIFSAIACAIVSAQSICCNEEPYSCNQTSKMGRSTDTSAIFLSESLRHSLGDQLQPRNHLEEKLLEFGSKNECCEIDCCENNNKASYIQPTLVQVENPFQVTESLFILKKGIDNKLEAYSQPQKTLSAPIYILTLSIIC